MIKLIIFDYDGVLVDSFKNVYNVYKKMCNELGAKSPKTINEFRSVYGYNFYECYKNLGVLEKDYEKANNIFKREIIKENPKLFKGIKVVLKKLNKNYILVLFSFNIKEEVEQKLKKFNINKYFQYAAGEDGNKKFSKKEEIEKLMKKYKINKKDVVLIGDRDIDYDLGLKLGLDNILLVDYGWGHNKTVKKEFVIKKSADILKVINKIKNN